MEDRFSRTELIYGKENMKKIFSSSVIVFGVGGVGGFAAEALVRAGIGKITIVDSDVVSVSNINRQIIALSSTVGMKKVDAAEMRFSDINPDCEIAKYDVFVTDDTIDLFDFSSYDYIVDAIDTVSAKLLLAEKADKLGVPIISSMGAGNKVDPTAFIISDIGKTYNDPLCRVMRRELKKRGIKKLNVCWSDEMPISPKINSEDYEKPQNGRRAVPGSVSFVPSSAGLAIAGYVINDIVEK